MNAMTATPQQTDLIPWARAVDQVPREDWQPVIDRLNAEFGTRYAIRRLPSSWMATDKNPRSSTTPTIYEVTTEKFVRELLNPGPRYGRTFTPQGPDRL